MEKLVCVLWKPAEVADAAFARALRDAAPELARHGAAGVRVNVVDDDVAAGEKVRVGRMDPPKAAMVSFWVDAADAARGPMLDALDTLAARTAAYLVVESVPLPNTTQVAPRGERTPGFNFVTCIVPRDGLDYDAFIRHWHGEHRRVACETQTTFAYVRNEIVRALTPDAPAWAAVVEESFPIEALTDPEVWYAAEGSSEKLAAHRQRMIESCLAFLALDRVEAHPMSEYVFD